MTMPSARAGEGASPERSARIEVENIGGINECEAAIPLGGAILTGRNATNRTSLLRAINAALGGTAATLKSNADEGKVVLRLDGETYTRTFTRNGSREAVEGSPYTSDETLVDGFACMLEDTPARRAVERGEDLRSAIMEPVDTTAIEREIRRLTERRDELSGKIDEAERDAQRIPTLEQRRTELRREIESIDGELSDLEEAIDSFDADAEAADEAEALVEEVEEKRRRVDELHDQIEQQKSKISELQAERESVEADLADLGSPDDDPAELETRLDDLREEKRALEETLTDLARIVEFNDELLDGAGDLVPNGASNDVTAALDPMSETVECWTCGSEVARDDIAERLDGLRAVVEEKRDEREQLEADVEAVRSRLSELERVERRETTLESKLDDVDRQIEHRRGKLADLEDDVEALEAEVAEDQQRVEETAELRNSDVLETYRRTSDLQYRRGKLGGELEDVESEIEACETAAEEARDLREQREEIKAEIASYRTKIDELERTAVEQFNEHMATVLDRLQYENVERVWIERLAQEADDDSEFELHVVRSSADGRVYEDCVANLSESEREVIGLIVGLAGYLTHEVHEEVPVMLLDSLEAIDADRIADLVEYLSEFVPHVVVALLPEDEQALPDDYVRVEADEIFT